MNYAYDYDFHVMNDVLVMNNALEYVKALIDSDLYDYLDAAWKDQAAKYRTLCQDAHSYISLLPRDVQNLIYPLILIITGLYNTMSIIDLKRDYIIRATTNCLNSSHGINVELKLHNDYDPYYNTISYKKTVKTIQNNQFTGPFTVFVNGRLIESGNLVNDNRHGTVILNDISTDKQHITDYVHGIRHGNYTFMQNSRELIHTAIYEDGALTFMTNYNGDQTIYDTTEYIKGVRHGAYTRFVNGEREMRAYYVENVKSGIELRYYPEDVVGNVVRLRSRRYYVNGNYEGKYEQWGEDGQLRSVTYWKNGVMVNDMH